MLAQRFRNSFPPLARHACHLPGPALLRVVDQARSCAELDTRERGSIGPRRQRLRQITRRFTSAGEQKSWDAGLSGTKRDGCGTTPMFAGFFGAPPADGGLKTFGWRCPPIRRFSSGPAGLVVNRAADRRVMDAPRGGDRPDPPVLAEIEAPNLGALRGRDHRSVSLLYAERPTVPGSTTGWPGRRRGSVSDPARRPAGARVWRVDGPDDRGDLPDCADGAPWRPVPEYFGGIDTIMWTWSASRCPSSTSLSRCRANSRSTPPRCRRTDP